jgi:hypothetical protein
MTKCSQVSILVLLAVGALASTLGRLRTPATEFPLTDLSARRITSQSTTRLPIYRVSCDGVAQNLPGDVPSGLPVVRVDFELDGKHVTLWLRDRAGGGDNEIAAVACPERHR